MNAFLEAISPSFLQPFKECDHTERLNDARQTDTAYLDGLRGLAALAVYTLHFWLPFDRYVLYGYGEGMSNSWLALPIIRCFYAGRAVVSIFFIMSGYVLTLNPARCYLLGDFHTLFQSLSKSTVKRAIRLFVPTIFSTFCVMLLVRAHALQSDVEALPAHYLHQHPIHQPTFWLQIEDWLGFVTTKLTNPWQWVEDIFGNNDDSLYGVHLWTIQTEFHCALVLYFMIMTLSQTKSIMLRNSLWAGTMLFCCFWSRWDVALFLLGMALSVLDLQRLQQKQENTTLSSPVWQSSRQRVFEIAPYLSLIAGLWLVSYPDLRGKDALGFRLLGLISPSEDLWHTIGAAITMWSIQRIRLARKVLTSSMLQYLGKVSFSMYIIHQPLLELVGWRLNNALRDQISPLFGHLGADVAFGVRVGGVIAYMLVTLVLVCASDYMWRAVDKPTLKLVRMAADRL